MFLENSEPQAADPHIMDQILRILRDTIERDLTAIEVQVTACSQAGSQYGAMIVAKLSFAAATTHQNIIKV